MPERRPTSASRRRVMAIGLATSGLATSLILPPLGGRALLAATPGCADGDDPTPRQTAGPYFTPESPLKTNFLDDDIPGQAMLLRGRVVDRSCRAIGAALVDLWQADGRGRYDNEGYRCRGHQFTDAAGDWQFTTVQPGLYPGRTRHFHLKVQAPGRPVLTTQLYFPAEPLNARDGLFRPDLRVALDTSATPPVASFTIVLDLG